MSQQTSAAKLVRLKSVNESMTGQKLRLVGRLLSYDSTSGVVLLVDEDHAVLVDVTFCVDGGMGGWVRERLGKVMVVGHLEAVPVPVRRINMWCLRVLISYQHRVQEEELPIPTLPTFSPAPVVDPALVVRAVLVEPSEELDLDGWHREIERRRESGCVIESGWTH
ncbi:hypothetical protein C0992_000371 [Termitomyces sp. T32_za158]|nr:hypothetical protein C0992_000371 [Termitomyces sp. T32_za158]